MKDDRNRLVSYDRENYDRVFNDYRCDDCDYVFKESEAGWKTLRVGSGMVDMACCPKCGTMELEEL